MTNKELIWSEALDKVANVLKSDDYQFFLDMGTLLGLVRDNAFIPWDNDIDIGVKNDSSIDIDRIKKTSERFYEMGFHVTSTSKKIALKQKDTDIEINILFYFENYNSYYFREMWMDTSKHFILSKIESHLLNRIVFKRGHGFRFKTLSYFSVILRLLGKLLPHSLGVYMYNRFSYLYYQGTVPKELLSDLVYTKFYDYKMPVPCRASSYLTYRYGNWETPIRDYNFLHDDRAISKNIG